MKPQKLKRYREKDNCDFDWDASVFFLMIMKSGFKWLFTRVILVKLDL